MEKVTLAGDFLCFIIALFWLQNDKWHNHLFHRDTSVLEGVAVVANVAVCIVVVDEEVVIVGEDIA